MQTLTSTSGWLYFGSFSNNFLMYLSTWSAVYILNSNSSTSENKHQQTPQRTEKMTEKQKPSNTQ
jgi:hypothetical protein